VGLDGCTCRGKDEWKKKSLNPIIAWPKIINFHSDN
jgi:hypothetical protein